MFSGPTQMESYTALPLHQRGGYQHQPQHQHHRHASDDRSATTQYAPPALLEPRTAHPRLPTFPESAAASQPRRDTFAGHAPVPALPATAAAPPRLDSRPQGQSLPRLMDILTSAAPPNISAPSSSSHAPLGAPWSAPATTPSTEVPPRHDGFPGLVGLHPPLAFPPPPLATRRLDVPSLDTASLSRDTLPPSQRSPRQLAHPDSTQEAVDSRHSSVRHSSTNGSYSSVSGGPSPYQYAGTDEYRSPLAGYDRGPAGQYGPVGSEAQGKYLGVHNVPGEGLFHMYEGGFRIPTQIDGEQVNPAWGLTKANKPRKRLAMACLDCREKKIKCEPGVTSCLQCEKAKRPCRKAPSHQTQNDSTSTTGWQSGGTPPARRDSSDPTQTIVRSAEIDPQQKRRAHEEYSPSSIPAKKHRTVSPVGFAPIRPAEARAAVAYAPPTAPEPPATMPRRASFMLDTDPYVVDPDLVVYLVQLYFANVNGMIYDMFPRHHFLHWVRSCQQKSREELMVLYAILAVGAVFVDDSWQCGERCAEIATEAISASMGRANALVVQARLIISTWYVSRGQCAKAEDYAKLAASAALYCRFDTERGCAESSDHNSFSRNEFNFSAEQLTESRRRTMWSVFLMDRYSGSWACQVEPRSIFIRLPCLDDRYERGIASDAPLFSDALSGQPDSPLPANSPISINGWLLLVAAIYGDVVNFVHRAPHQPTRSYKDTYRRVYDSTIVALEEWTARLPEYLHFSSVNIERSVEGGYAGPLTAMHILRHFAAMKLNRFFRHSLIPRAVGRNICATRHHALALLDVMLCLRRVRAEAAPDGRHPTPFAFTLPFAGNATLAAIDIVGAGGPETSLRSSLETIWGGLECLRELAQYWMLAGGQLKACETRYYQIQNILRNPHTARSGCWLGREWGVTAPLEREFAAEDDCIYGVSDRTYFDAFKETDASPTSPHAATNHYRR